MNRKAKCTVYLRDLQQQTGLTDEALQLIARVCGPRSVCNINVWLIVCIPDDLCCHVVPAPRTTGYFCQLPLSKLFVLSKFVCNLWHKARCCHRYEPKNGLLTLVSEKHSMREENRPHITELIARLVLEGHQAFPPDDREVIAAKLEQKQ